MPASKRPQSGEPGGQQQLRKAPLLKPDEREKGATKKQQAKAKKTEHKDGTAKRKKPAPAWDAQSSRPTKSSGERAKEEAAPHPEKGGAESPDEGEERQPRKEAPQRKKPSTATERPPIRRANPNKPGRAARSSQAALEKEMHCPPLARL